MLGLALTAIAADNPPSGDQTTITGFLLMFDDTLSNAEVTFTLSGDDLFYTTSGSVVTPGQSVVRADDNGYFRCTLWGVDSLTGFNGGTATYSVSVSHPVASYKINRLKIAANGDTTTYRSVVAQ